MMLDYRLTLSERAELRAEHRKTRDQREADRIKAVLSLADGWKAEQVAQILLIDPNTVRTWFKRYREGGVSRLLEVEYRGSECALNAVELAVLEREVDTRLYLTSKAVAAWVEERFGVSYTTNAIESLDARLHKIIKTRGHFPSDDAATKLIWLALRNITTDWGRASRDWKDAMNQFAILYAERFEAALG